ncbi:hypothetical protein Pan189_31130 [Stratiformator vulcanicus]|uniref:Uncharacterized protein n=1 Tax=Stratiformator vulcanicus TaxID=2527980 RepID=A0A517R4B9_9PLAN|nr:hypothetical protein Pan189_31130 [Stratiformator vulcanicus]
MLNGNQGVRIEPRLPLQQIVHNGFGVLGLKKQAASNSKAYSPTRSAGGWGPARRAAPSERGLRLLLFLNPGNWHLFSAHHLAIAALLNVAQRSVTVDE